MIKKLKNRLICLVRGHIYYDCICGRCGKHLFDAPIKRLFKRIICLVRGHEWEWEFKHYFISKEGYYEGKCARCGKIKEE